MEELKTIKSKMNTLLNINKIIRNNIEKENGIINKRYNKMLLIINEHMDLLIKELSTIDMDLNNDN